ncbi:hypothetical protein HYFRA_00001310 [Hymenoscyphus fraxineus]|uniref:Fe2OG dioxygenase domain-containing protein n=1 Tax=Hymenoscyphus fraxineus TaxID=746836 RepID=A0A9N9L9H2_9HELO|nr:hypothetical protein HYFRA_00001310 [Hymenoscyphus fraxineus]
MPPSPKTKTTKLELRTALGRVYRDVLTTPPRDCTEEEIPVISLAPLFLEDDDLGKEAKRKLAKRIRNAAVETGFFYVRDHGIPMEVVERARGEGMRFFRQSEGVKGRVRQGLSRGFNGWKEASQTNISPGETADLKESVGPFHLLQRQFMWQYDPKYDPDPKPLDDIPEEVKPHLRAEEFVWEGTSHLPAFKPALLAYWSSCLTLSRQLLRIFALSLSLPATYFDSRVTYPGADGVINYYPPVTAAQKAAQTVGLGSHTDLQLFTLLWQDMTGGLQVLNRQGQWINAKPIEGTLVVNIGDFLMRLRLNFNCVEGVIPTCCSEENPAKYEPISCGDWCHLRFSQEKEEFEEKMGIQAKAPSGRVIAA